MKHPTGQVGGPRHGVRATRDDPIPPDSEELPRMDEGRKDDTAYANARSDHAAAASRGRIWANPSREMPSMIARWPRWVRLAIVVLLAGAVVVGVPAIREPILRAAGWALVFDEPVEPADIVVVTVAAGSAGILEAADLVHSGIVQRVAVFADPPDAVDQEFMRRGIPDADEASWSVRKLRLLGVTAIEQDPRAVAGTEDMGEMIPDWCDRHQFRSVIVVSTPDHSRRLHRVLHRAMRDHQTRVRIRVTRHSGFDPDRWWETRHGIRTGIIELQKLLFDLIRHPLP